MGIVKVVPLPERHTDTSYIDDMRCRRLALQLATQLPDDLPEALRVLDHARTLVRGFLADPSPV